MHHFFAGVTDIFEDSINIKGDELRHLRDVLRVKEKELVLVSDEKGYDYICETVKLLKESALLKILKKEESKTELVSKITLFQALPKLDKMELIIQKATELGVYKIVPVMTKRCIQKLDEKKKGHKLERWQEISKAAAKQSKRNIIPQIDSPLKYTEALESALSCKHKLLAYENDRGIKNTLEKIECIGKGEDIAIFIGSEGGFEEDEIAAAKEKGFEVISLGNRILRTESAGLCILSLLMFHLEDING